MSSRTRLQRAFPYILIGCVSFALAVVVAYLFILPAPQPEDTVAVSSNRPVPNRPTDGAPAPEEIMPDIPDPALPPLEPPQVISVVPIAVPDLVGKDMWEMQELLDKMRLVVIIRRDTSSFELPNTVIRQTPPPGQRVFPNDTVVVTISQFPPAR